MDSAIIKNLKPEFEPVAVVWSDTIPYAEAETAGPRAVMGMLGAEGREMMRRRFRDDVLTLTVPAPLFLRMEQEADDCIFQIPSWEKFINR